MTYVLKMQAKKTLEDFEKKHSHALFREEKYFFGLFTRKVRRTFWELIESGEITPEEADAVTSAQVIYWGF